MTGKSRSGPDTAPLGAGEIHVDLRDELAPEDNAELLGMMGEARRFSRREDESGWERAKRDLVLEMFRHPLLIAVEGVAPATRPGPRDP